MLPTFFTFQQAKEIYLLLLISSACFFKYVPQYSIKFTRLSGNVPLQNCIQSTNLPNHWDSREL